MAVALRQTHPITDDELEELSRLNPGYQLELAADGCLLVTPAGMNSDRRCVEIARQLGNWNADGDHGEVFGSSAGFRLPDGSVLSPDAAWVSRERWDALTLEQQERFGPLSPDAVFEVLSRSDSLEYLRSKMELYIRNGVRIAVLIDAYEKIAEVYRPEAPVASVSPDAQLSLDPELQGFVLDLPAIFR